MPAIIARRSAGSGEQAGFDIDGLVEIGTQPKDLRTVQDIEEEAKRSKRRRGNDDAVVPAVR